MNPSEQNKNWHKPSCSLVLCKPEPSSPGAPGHCWLWFHVLMLAQKLPKARPSLPPPLLPEADVLNYCESLLLRGFQGGWKLKTMKIWRVSACLRVSPSCLKSEWGKLGKKKKIYVTLSSPFFIELLQLSSFPKPPFLLFSHSLSWLHCAFSTDCLSPSLPLFSLPFSIWLQFLFPHRPFPSSPSSPFHILTLQLFPKLNQNPQLFSRTLTILFSPFLYFFPPRLSACQCYLHDKHQAQSHFP